VKIAQEQLGHASIATTLNIYTHAVDASHRKAIEAVERELFVVLDHSGLQTAAGVERAPAASDRVN
jgi:site-specific recombinase XerC